MRNILSKRSSLYTSILHISLISSSGCNSCDQTVPQSTNSTVAVAPKAISELAEDKKKDVQDDEKDKNKDEKCDKKEDDANKDNGDDETELNKLTIEELLKKQTCIIEQIAQFKKEDVKDNDAPRPTESYAPQPSAPPCDIPLYAPQPSAPPYNIPFDDAPQPYNVSVEENDQNTDVNYITEEKSTIITKLRSNLGKVSQSIVRKFSKDKTPELLGQLIKNRECHEEDLAKLEKKLKDLKDKKRLIELELEKQKIKKGTGSSDNQKTKDTDQKIKDTDQKIKIKKKDIKLIEKYIIKIRESAAKSEDQPTNLPQDQSGNGGVHNGSLYPSLPNF